MARSLRIRSKGRPSNRRCPPLACLLLAALALQGAPVRAAGWDEGSAGGAQRSRDARDARAATAVAASLPPIGILGTPLAAPIPMAAARPLAARPGSGERGHVDAMAASYDFGGTGLSLEGDARLRADVRALVRLGVALDYRELLLGVSYRVTPPWAGRLTLVLTAGAESGRFELEAPGVSTTLADTGPYLDVASHLVLDERFELQAGVGYSGFFGGDPILFGGGVYRVGRRLDAVSRVELGDNDSLGIGIRYRY